MKPYYQDDSVTIYHGDCAEVLLGIGANLNDHVRPADLTIFDPPYNVGKNYGAGSHDRRSVDEYRGWLWEVLAQCGIRTRGLAYFPGVVNIGQAFPLIDDAGWEFVRLLGWHRKEFAGDKWTGGPAMSWEPILWATRLGTEPAWNRLYGHGGRDFLVVNSTHGNTLDHPCPKPMRVMSWLIGLLAPEAGMVLDPTCGTGTALRAAKDLGRRAVGIEIEERYCEIAAKQCAQGVLALSGQAERMEGA